jgi:hypothetical protein
VAEAAELETWVREELSLEPGDGIVISEKPGTDPRCSPVVTQVAIAGATGEPSVFHIEQALAEVSRMDLVAALAFGGGH